MDKSFQNLEIDKKNLIKYLHGRIEHAFKYKRDAPPIDNRKIVVIISNDIGEILFSRQIGSDDNVTMNVVHWKAAFENIDTIMKRGLFLFGGAIKLRSGIIISICGLYSDDEFFQSLSGHVAIELDMIDIEEKVLLSKKNQTFNFSNFAAR